MTAFDHPLILRGIQRKGKRGNEPQNFGIPGTSIDLDDGLIRAGIITSTTRAVIDAIRLGKWMVSIKGLLWSVKQFGLQQSNPNVENILRTTKRRTKIWTPINTLASAIGAQIGLHPNRHGFTPFDGIDGGYEWTQKKKMEWGQRLGDSGLGIPKRASAIPSSMDNRLVSLYNESFSIIGQSNVSKGIESVKGKGLPFITLAGMGGPNSVYGLIPGGKIPVRGVDTREKNIVFKPGIGKEKFKVPYAPYTIQHQYATFVPTPSAPKKTFTPVVDSLVTPGIKENITAPIENRADAERLKKLVEDDDKFSAFGAPLQDLNGRSLEGKDSDGRDIGTLIPGSGVINDYETIAYGKIPDRLAGDTSDIDFRSLLTGNEKDRSLGNSEKDPKIDTTKNIATRVGFQNPGAMGVSENRTDWGNTDSTANGFLNRFDKINAADVTEPREDGTLPEPLNDLVHLWFKVDGGNRIQFRGTVSGITDTFSPSWNAIKYNGRADQAYQYSTFERSLSFNFKVYATSRIEMKPIYKKLSYLASMTMPVYGSTAGYQGQLINFRLGDLFNDKQAFIESLSYSMSDEAPWDIDIDKDNPLGELPMGVDVTVGLKILGTKPSSKLKQVYDATFMA